MANRYFRSKVLSADARPILLSGKIVLNSSAAVVSNNLDFTASVTKTGTGTYTVTLQDKYAEVKSIQVSHAGAELDVEAKVVSEAISSAKTIALRTEIAGVAANVTAACEIHILIVVNDSSVTR